MNIFKVQPHVRQAPTTTDKRLFGAEAAADAIMKQS
jgi:hypothetical protein